MFNYYKIDIQVFRCHFSYTGFGLGIAFHTCCSYYVGYFDKRFGLANGLFNISSAVSFVSVPPLVKESFDCFGTRGTLQLMAAVMANICVCGALLRPPKTVQLQKRHKDGKSHRDQDATVHENLDSCFSSLLKDVAKDFDLALFRSARFIFQSVVNGILFGGCVSPIIYIVPYAESIGISGIKAPLLMSVIGACSIIIRVIPLGLFVDKQVVSAASLTVAGSILSAVAIILFSFFNTFPALATFTGLFGIGWGVVSTFIIVIVAHSGGSKDKSSAAIAWTILGRGAGSFATIYGGGK